jgi:intracellular septation protein
MSGITMISEDASFIKMKPALIYICIGCFLLVDLMILKKFFIGKMYQSIFEQKGIVLTRSILKRLTAHWIILLFLSAFTNEVIWRVFGEGAWVNFKVFVMPLILVLMMLGHVLYVSEYAKRI